MKLSLKCGFGPSGVIFCAFFTIAAVAGAGTYSGGSGTAGDPYKISTVADWTNLAIDPNNWDKHFIVLNDIDFSGINLTPVARDTDATKTGYQGTPFTGILDGAGYALLNVVISLPANDYVGLFGLIISPGEIRNIGVENATITGKSRVGVVTASTSGTLLRCHASGIAAGSDCVGMLVGINNGMIDSCYVTGQTKGGLGSIGMLIGGNTTNGVVRRCYATGEVEAVNGISVGGLIGVNQGGSIASCYSTAAVTGGSWVGGLIGSNRSGLVDSCYSSGAVAGIGTLGGLIGLNSVPVLSCFWNIEISGQAGSSGGKGLTSIQMRTITIFQNAGWADKGWVIQDGIDFPRLAWEETPGVDIPAAGPPPFQGSGTQFDPYQIGSADDWGQLSWHRSILDKHLSLMMDLDLADVVLYPIGDLGPFVGVFEGNGRVIRNAVITMENSDDVGLFGSVGVGGRIQNLALEGARISGQTNVGSLIGRNNGTVTRCSTTAIVEGNNDYESESTGGLIGRHESGSVIQCSAKGTVSGGNRVGGLMGWSRDGIVRECFTVVEASGDDFVGGLIGYNSGIVESCYAQGPVTALSDVGGLIGKNGGSVHYSYSCGLVTGSKNVGGLCGYADGSIWRCIWDTDTSGIKSNGHDGGLKTAAMKSMAWIITYPYYWDFVGNDINGTEDVWRLCADGISYPRLSWEFSNGGDMDCPDGVGLEDLVYLAGRWMAGTPATIGAADADGNGKVDLGDFVILSEQWMK
jgi:hypothetical protein